MDSLQKTAIIIPCYNEAKRLRTEAIIGYADSTEHVRFIFVNDGSRDNTQDVLESVGRMLPGRATVIRMKKNIGKAEAVRQGVLEAIRLNSQFIGYWDADFSAPLTEIENLLQLFDPQNIHMVIGSRVKMLGHDIKRGIIRHYLGRAFATYASLILNLPVYDTQCGAKIFRNSDDLKKVFSFPFNVNWIFDVEILARFKILYSNRSNLSLKSSAVECPLKVWKHVGDSKIGVKNVFAVATEIFYLAVILHIPYISSKYRSRLLV
jgi:glycosyltransferase involved in cell wall biosynthesis